MIANTGMPEAEVVAEIERYFVMPGQALAYKVGMNKILELRERAKTALGDKFSLARFHDFGHWAAVSSKRVSTQTLGAMHTGRSSPSAATTSVPWP